MLFYKIQGVIVNCEDAINEESDRRARREFSRKIMMKTAEFNRVENARFCFLSEAYEGAVSFGVITKRAVNLLKLAESYARAIGLEVKDLALTEITFSSLQSMLGEADHQNYVEDSDDILVRFELNRISGRYARGLEFGENLIVGERSREELKALSGELFMSESMEAEIERIYAGSKTLGAMGHPVHYIVETDDRDVRREAYKIILDALYANHRLGSSRYAFLDFAPGKEYSRGAYESLYKICEGGAVVVRYLPCSDEEDASSAMEYDMIEHLCEVAKRHRNSVLTVFCFPRECKNTKALFYESLGTMSFVELREDFIGAQGARELFARFAREKRVRCDKKLFEKIEGDRCYLARELRDIFDEWYDSKLKRTVYPQYKEISVARKEVSKAKPKGSAYDELNEMIGLSAAKSVINKALGYYKMQKLYEEKGVKRDNPAMHMVFTGNPGTAKTTVARLFARIMRENNLLSKGHIVEVGRGDLVGRYVGWTAQTVQSKFKAAMGGVLFIDEAYSLVDDRDGSFGDEAINTIVQEMENHRSDVVVIFAGYPDRMEGFLQKNPGLRSRIAFHVPFADYESAELCQIADMISRKNGMKLEKKALDKLERVFDAAKRESDFGNGRYVRNLFEQAKMNQATRLLEKDFDSITSEDVTTITADDIVIPDVKRQEKRRIGFY